MCNNTKKLMFSALLFALLFVAMCTFGSTAFAATCTSTAAGDWSTKEIWDCGHVPAEGDDVVITTNVNIPAELKIAIINDLTINSGRTLTQTNKLTQTISGLLTILSGGILTHANNLSSNTVLYSVDFAAADIDVQPGAIIAVANVGNYGGKPAVNSGEGYGTGHGGASSYAGGGGGHAGVGGAGSNAGVAAGHGGSGSLCSVDDPSTMGSGGGTGTMAGGLTMYGGKGAGLVKLSASGTLTMDGTISAYGSDGSSGGSMAVAGGGGAGGAVKLIADTVNIGGVINVNGGKGAYVSGSTKFGGGGGGGCMSIIYTAGYNNTGSTFNKSGGASLGNAGGEGVLTLTTAETPPPAVLTPPDNPPPNGGSDTTPPVLGQGVLNATLPTPTRDTIKLTWTPASDDTTPSSLIIYKFYMSKSTEVDKEPFIELPQEMQPSVGTTTLNVTPVSKNAYYCFKYTAQDQAGNISSLDNCTENCIANTLSFPMYYKSTPTSIRLMWPPLETEQIIEPGVYEFKVLLSTIDPSELSPNYTMIMNSGEPAPGVVEVVTTTNTSYEFNKGITPNTNYCYVLTVTAWGKFSGNLIACPITTPPISINVTPPNNPPVFSQTSIKPQPSYKNIQLTWYPATDPDGDAITYQVYYSTTNFTVDTRRQYTIMKSGSLSGYNLIGLTPNTAYYILVTATDSKGAVSGLSNANIKTVKTLSTDVIAPTLGASFWAENILTNAVTLKWNPAKDNVTLPNIIQYRLYGDVNGSHQFKLVSPQPAIGITSVTITNLTSGTQYCYYYEAVDEAGKVSTKSVPICAVTK